MSSSTIEDLLQLPKKKRLEIAEKLWLSVADEEKMPVPEAHQKILRRRLGDYRAGRERVLSHDALMRQVRSA
jgi:putative addiction module component (TIGR02574 family)